MFSAHIKTVSIYAFFFKTLDKAVHAVSFLSFSLLPLFMLIEAHIAELNFILRKQLCGLLTGRQKRVFFKTFWVDVVFLDTFLLSFCTEVTIGLCMCIHSFCVCPPQAMTCPHLSDATAAISTRRPSPTDRCLSTLSESRKGTVFPFLTDDFSIIDFP